MQTTGGLTAEAQTGGVIINTISRDGGNEFHGTFNADFGHRELQGDNINDELRARGATLTGTIRKLYDVGFGIGGPLKRDRVWFYASARKCGAPATRAGNYYNKSANPLFYEPDLSRPAYDRNLSQETSLRITWQVAGEAEDHRLGTLRVQLQLQPRHRGGGSSRPRRPGATGTRRCCRARGQWTYPATNRLLFQAGARDARRHASAQAGRGGRRPAPWRSSTA